jgi:hypothetical protein
MTKIYSATIFNLNNEWDFYSKRYSINKQEASLQMGWSVSFFGSLLRGSSSLSLENLIKIANYMQISPRRIDPDYLSPAVDSYDIHGTTSGAEPPAGIRYFKPGKLQYWVDKRVPIYNNSATEKHRIQYFSEGLTLFCTEEDVPHRIDKNFLTNAIPFWLVFSPTKETVAIHSTKKPAQKQGKVYRIVGLHML